MSDAGRRQLNFNSEDDVIAEVRRLRASGCTKRGNWSLPQICMHLDRAVQYRMQPGPYAPDTPEQNAKKPLVAGILASGKLPQGITAPDAMIPPADCGEESIDSFLATMERYKRFPAPPRRTAFSACSTNRTRGC